MALPGRPQTKCSIANIGHTATRAPPGQRSGARSTMAEKGGGFIGRSTTLEPIPRRDQRRGSVPLARTGTMRSFRARPGVGHVFAAAAGPRVRVPIIAVGFALPGPAIGSVLVIGLVGRVDRGVVVACHLVVVERPAAN